MTLTPGDDSREGILTSQIDWDGDGDYSETFEDLSNRRLANQGVSVTIGRDQDKAFAPPRIAASNFGIDNTDQKYSNDYSASPVYQLVTPGKRVKQSLQYGSKRAYNRHATYNKNVPYNGIANYPLFLGKTDRISSDPSIGVKNVIIPCIGLLATIKNKKLTTTQLYEGIRTDEAITTILNLAGWPVGKRIISIGDSVLKYWWLANQEAYPALLAILNSEGAGAAIFEDYDGNIVFQNRNYRTTNASSITSQATIYDRYVGASQLYNKHSTYTKHELYVGKAGAYYYEKLGYDPGWDSIINVCDATVNDRTLASLAPIWSYGSSLVLAGGQTFTISFIPSVPAKGVINPVAGTDYLVGAGSVITMTATPSSGQVFTVTVTAGGGGATINGLQVRGQLLNSSSQRIITNSNTTGAAIEDQVHYSVPLLPDTDFNYVQSIVDSYVTSYQDVHPSIQITVPNYDARTLRKIMTLKISDRITIYNKHLGLEGIDLFIESLSHNIMYNGRMHRLQIGTSKVTGITGGAWDVGHWFLFGDPLNATWGT